MSKQKTVSAIVPVFNEGQTIKEVVDTLTKSPIIGEVIVVNDGSTDKTVQVLKKFKNQIKLINLKTNRGKGHALSQGIKKAQGEIVTFWDGDLIGLQEKHLKKVLNPLLKGEAIASVGYPKQVGVMEEFAGQRAYFKKDLIPHLGKMSQAKFGVEVFLNSLFQKPQAVSTPLEGLKHLRKYEKYKPPQAARGYFKSTVEIAKALILNFVEKKGPNSRL